MTRRAQMVLVLIIALATGLRAFHLGDPKELVFDESHYVPSARVMAGLIARDDIFNPDPWKAQPLIARTPDPNFSHPPIGKFFISLGMRLFGDTPLGWRLPGLFFSVLSLIGFALLAHRLTQSTPATLLATAFLGMDFMHIVLTRTAMLDIYLFTFATFAMLVHAKYVTGCGCKHAALWTGLLIGLTIGVKESSINLAFAAGVTTLMFGQGTMKMRLKHGVIMALCTCVGYGLTSFYYLANGYSLLEWLRFRIDVASSLVHPLAEHRYTSRAWGWAFNYKPVWFFWHSVKREGMGDLMSGIVCLGNPVIWIGFILSSYVLFAEWWTARRDQLRSVLVSIDPLTRAGAFVLVWYAALYVPLFVMLWKRDGFLYHHFLSVQPVTLGLAIGLVMLDRRAVLTSWRFLRPAPIMVGLSLLALVAFLPVLLNFNFSDDYMEFLRSIVAM